MLLGELFTELSFIEFANLSLSEEASGKIQEESQARFVTSTNEALLELHKRFLLSEKELIIQAITGKSKYPLKRKHARTDGTPNVTKFIIDTPSDPFIGDLIHITAVNDSCGALLPVNDADKCNSVFTPTVDVLQLTHPKDGDPYFITYRASHPVLTYDGVNEAIMLAQQVDVPLALKTALRQKIAANFFTSMSGQEYSTQAQAFEAKFQASCAEVAQENLVGPSEINTNRKLEKRGFC